MKSLLMTTRSAVNMASRQRHHRFSLFVRLFIALLCIVTLQLAKTPGAAAAVTSVTPKTWNTIGLDSNTPASGPNNFPVGARVCGNTPGEDVLVSFHWDSTNPYVSLRPGSFGDPAGTQSLLKLGETSTPDGYCADAMFEVIVTKNSAAFTTSTNLPPRFHITAGSLSTPVPRELYVERLVSQARNAVTDMKFGTSLATLLSVPNGGSMTLIKGNTYFIQLSGYTATQGYEQLEAFVNFDTALFQILSVSMAGTAGGASIVPSLYADPCIWENDPNSPNYRACTATGKFGGNITVTYEVKILEASGDSQKLSSLIHDFSGSSFHYNADYSTSARFANLIDPANLNFSKGFFPNPTDLTTGSNLSLTVTNPNAGTISGLNFTDPFPGAMRIGTPLTGTVTVLAGTPTTVTGTGTSFLTQLAVGNTIIINGASYTVSAIASNTSLTVTTTVPAITGTKAAGASIAGTISVTNGSPTITGTGTAFTSSLSIGDLILISGVQYKVAAIASATSLTLTTNYAGTTASGLQVKYLANSTCGGTLTDSSGNPLNIGSSGIRLSDGTVQANGSCVVSTKVAVPATGTYNNTSNNLFSGTTDTGKSAFASLVVGTTAPPAPPPSSCANPVELARWEMNVTTLGPPGNGPLVTSKADNVSTASANFVSAGGGSQTVGVISGRTYAWGGTSGPGSWTENPTAPNYTLNNYFEFVLDTSNYGGVGVTFDAGLFANGDWGNPTSPMLVTTSSGAGFTLEASGSVGKGSWGTGLTAAATATGTNTTTFRIATNGASKPAAQFVLDNIIFTGCPRIKPPTISKKFEDNPILANGVSTLSFLLTNPNAGTDLTGLQFSDTFPTSPANMLVASSSPGMGTVTTSTSSTTVTGSGTYFTSLLSPGALIVINGAPRTVASIQNDTQLTLTANAAATGSGLPITGTASGCGSPSYTPTPAAGSINFSGGTITASGTCVVTVNVTASAEGSYVNTTSAVAATGTSGGQTASDTLVISAPHPAVGLLKEISASASPSLWGYYLALPVGSNVYYQLSVYNDGDVPLAGVTISDPDIPAAYISGCAWKDGDETPITYPFNLEVANNSNNRDFAYCILAPVTALEGVHTNIATASVTYGGSVYTDEDWANYATTGLTLAKEASQNHFIAADDILDYSYLVTNSGYASLPGPVTVTDNKTTVTCPAVNSVGDLDNYFDPGESLTCTASYTVTADDVTAMSVTNTATARTPSGFNIAEATSNSSSKTVWIAPTLTKAFSTGSIAVGQTATLTFTVTNPAGAPARSGGLTFTDTFPADLLIAGTPNVVNNCGGTPTITADAGTGIFSVVGTGVNAESGVSSCTILVDVTSNIAGSYVNGSGQITAIAGLVNGITDQTLVVVDLPSITLVKSVQTYSDPVNGLGSPKAIPGAIMQYTIQIINSGSGAVDLDSTVITDAIPANTVLCANAVCNGGSAPVTGFCSGPVACGLTFTFDSDTAFSTEVGGGAPYTYFPSTAADGYDSTITGARFNPKGILNSASGGNNSIFILMFKVMVK